MCVSSETSVDEAKHLSELHQVHHLLVLLDYTLIGVICTCDMEASPGSAFVSEFMREPLTLSLEHTWRDAVELMNECGVGSVILLENETPRGIVTRGDILHGHPPPDLEVEIERCSCCGATSHLRRNDLGRSLCQFCRKLPRGDRSRPMVPPPFSR